MFIYDNINLDTLPLWASFVLCLSITTGGLLVLFRFRQTRTNSSFLYLQIFLILLYVYGYYSLWSGMLLSGFMEIDNVERVTTVVAQLGAPFYIVSLTMLLLWAARIQKQPAVSVLIITASVSAAAIVALLNWGPPVEDSVRAACSIVALVTSLSVVGTLVTGKQEIVKYKSRPLLIALAAAAGLIHLTTFTGLTGYAHYNSVFIFYFYLLNTAMVVVYTYQATDELMQPQLSIDDFLLKHGISKREADILRGIYAGKTNQEIANQLFISLQTVKDHSSRIYQKTFVKNRAQLTTLVRESQGGSGERS
ncbi:MAG: LuxR family transcriptional regulator [Gammaproteobacteria bacterium]|nr:LuxR family transcriptional regulator [Gammaproteobacteria bacterium]